MTKKLKTPSDYQQFSFRISEEDKEELTKRLDRILILQKKNQNPGDYTPKKNTLLIRALKRGLSQIEKEELQKH